MTLGSREAEGPERCQIFSHLPLTGLRCKSGSYLSQRQTATGLIQHGEDRLLPGKSYSLTITLPTVAISFEKGHRIQLIVSAANHPRYERNSHTGADHYEAKAALDVQVELSHGGEGGSRLLLPVQ